jgi:quinol monooxygenase YgiN
VRWVAKLGSEARVAEILDALAPASRAEPGVVRYDIFRLAGDSRTFFLIESYESLEALDAHTLSAHVQELVFGEVLDLLEERVRTYLEPL